MLSKLFDRFDKKRDVIIEVTDYGVYSSRKLEAIYNDSDKCYRTKSWATRCLKVSTVDSFVDFIAEEFKRARNETGNNATVVINRHGGNFNGNDNFENIGCNYERSLTTGWIELNRVANTKINHETLLTTLQKLRPYIENFEDLYLTLLDIRSIGRSEMISNPVFVPGDDMIANSGYKITYKLQSGTQEDVTLPNRFEVILPYSRGRQDVCYRVPVELLYLNNGNGRIEIVFQVAELEQIEEQALQDEVDYLKSKLAQFKDLLVLLNY